MAGQTYSSSLSSSSPASWGKTAARVLSLGFVVRSTASLMLRRVLCVTWDVGALQVCSDVLHSALHAVQLSTDHDDRRLHQGKWTSWKMMQLSHKKWTLACFFRTSSWHTLGWCSSETTFSPGLTSSVWISGMKKQLYSLMGTIVPISPTFHRRLLDDQPPSNGLRYFYVFLNVDSHRCCERTPRRKSDNVDYPPLAGCYAGPNWNDSATNAQNPTGDMFLMCTCDIHVILGFSCT